MAGDLLLHELAALAYRLQEPCATGCGELGRCEFCKDRFRIGLRLTTLVNQAIAKENPAEARGGFHDDG